VRLFILARHGESTLNLEQRINGDPNVPVDLTERGRGESQELRLMLANVPLDACVHTRFARTLQTAEIALGGRDIRVEVEPLLDDIDIGELEGQRIEDYRAWKHEHARSDRFPGGESLDDAARRYAEAFRRLLAGSYGCVLVVTHEIPIRYALNGAVGSDTLDGPAHQLPNATPFLFDERALERAVTGIEAVVGRVTA
jgi:broad specificity phosphatase PhoE